MLDSIRREVAAWEGARFSVWRTHRIEGLHVDEKTDPPTVVALVRAPTGPPLLGMRHEAEPEEGRDSMDATAWGSVCVTSFEEAIDTTDEPGDPPSEDGIRWLET